ncbi:LOW QUALITY PROTEIN: UDP-glucuronosyltransferase 2B31-like [Mytilus edulis]|uniref:LOW QUALITY PROTEIN: UDP-glucuronosyltransferase 2B31-like n=1 Tax=Mytilus edulis TaxID=6550 RepID=UPI0039EE4823
MLKYASNVWDQYFIKDINALERVQSQAVTVSSVEIGQAEESSIRRLSTLENFSQQGGQGAGTRYPARHNDELFGILKFDYAIVDYDPFVCYEILGYKLSLPFILSSAHYDPSLHRTPFNPAYMPALLSGYIDKMTFLERMINIGYFNGLSNSHRLECHFMWWISSQAAKSLISRIEAFVEKSKDGLVIVAFDSIIKSCLENIMNKLISSFQKLKHFNFIFRNGDYEKEYGNILLLPWLPQNDLLGQVKTKLFITHCGKSSIFEALYHGVPMLFIPIALDQISNAAVLKEKGYGISMDILDFSMNELVDNINKVVHNSSFMFSIKNASAIFHSRPQTPTQRAANWIDLVTKYGSEHFRPARYALIW